MFNPAVYENTRPDGVPVLEVIPDDDTRKRPQPRLFVPLKRSALRGEIVGPLASLRLEQTFGYTRAQLDKVIEAHYRFPLPGDAAVTAVRVRFGEVEIIAELKERGAAEAEYDEARKQGQQAALATRESSSVFTLRVAGIRPEEDVVVETQYVQLARPEGQGWSLRVPLTTAPRYVRDDEASSRPAEGQPLLLLRDPGHRFSLDVVLRDAATVTSPTHALDVVEPDADASAPEDRHVRLRGGEVLPDRDCVLVWTPRQTQEHPALHVRTYDDTAAGWTYLLALVAPPAASERLTRVPREVTLLVDHSGSMRGPKWESSDWAVARFLNGLSPQDALALCLFHTTTRWFADQMRAADSETVQAALRFVQDNKDSGGTNMGVALEQALGIAPLAGEHARHLLLVTDAQVSDEGRIRRLVDEEAARTPRRRTSVLCIDAAPNAFLAHEIADRGGGMARFLTSSPEEEDITTALEQVLSDWDAPVHANLTLNVNREAAQATGRALLPGAPAGWQAIDLGDLPAGRAIWVAARVPLATDAPLRCEVHAAGKRLAEAEASPVALPALKALFGARRVLALEYLIGSGYTGDDLRDQLERLGYGTDDLARVSDRKHIYAENAREEVAKALKALLVREALDYGLASSETAFVAVRKEKGEVVAGTVPVANALPSGWSEEFLSPGAMFFMRSSGVADMSMGGFGQPQAPASTNAGMGAQLAALQRKGGARPHRKEAAPARPVTPPASARPTAPSGSVTLFEGTPVFQSGQALLFDSNRSGDAGRLAGQGTIRQLAIAFAKGAPDADALDAGLMLLIYVGDLATPRARASLRDMLRQGGSRPLNLALRAGDVVRVVLLDPNNVWARVAPTLRLSVLM